MPATRTTSPGRAFAIAVAIALAVELARPGDLVLVAGKGHEDYQIVGTEKHPLDDRDEVRRALARLA